MLDDATFGVCDHRRDPQRQHADLDRPAAVSATPVLVTYTVVVDNPVTGDGTLTNAVTG